MDTATETKTGVAVDVSRGDTNFTVSNQWANRPDDERFLTLDSLLAHCAGRQSRSGERVLTLGDLKVGVGPHGLEVATERGGALPSNWAFSQLTGLAESVPPRYLKELPDALAADCVNHALQGNGQRVKAYVQGGDTPTLRALTGPKYGRIYDYEVVKEVQRLGNGWKIPGNIDWGSHRYNPAATGGLESTTLYASDRDVFLFLVKDDDPIQVGTLDNGEPDYLFRGFYAWNSEVGSKSLGCATFFFRAVCGNRCIWGMEEFNQFRIRHSDKAPQRLYTEFRPRLEAFAQSSPKEAIEYVMAAKSSKLGVDTGSIADGMSKVVLTGDAAATIHKTFTRGEIAASVQKAWDEEKKMDSVWDFVQGATAQARSIQHADSRVNLETRAGSLMALANN